jgi:hypothetical protein
MHFNQTMTAIDCAEVRRRFWRRNGPFNAMLTRFEVLPGCGVFSVTAFAYLTAHFRAAETTASSNPRQVTVGSGSPGMLCATSATS